MADSFLFGVGAGVGVAALLVGLTYLAARSRAVSAAALSAFGRPVRVALGLSTLAAVALLGDLYGPQFVQRTAGVDGGALGAAAFGVAFGAPFAYGAVAVVAATAGVRRLDVELDDSADRYAAVVGYVDAAFPWTAPACFGAMLFSIPAAMLVLPAALPYGDAWVAGATGVGFYTLLLGFGTAYDGIAPQAPQNRVAEALE